MFWSPLTQARSLLFVPGHRPDRFAKAANSGADDIVLDIEDAVAPQEKPLARENIGRWFASGGTGVVRINGYGTPWYDDDVAMLSDHRCAVMLPKTSGAAEIADLLDRLPAGSGVLPLLETSAGVLNAREVCAAPGVVRAVFGNADLAREIGIDLADQPALAFARSQVVLASAAAGAPAPIDGVTVALEDLDLLRSDAAHAVEFGFTGKLCLHPRQVPVVNAAFSPSAEEVQWAREIVAASGNGSVTARDGHVVGKPIVDRARRVLAVAR
ncbi:citrate lyase subunit beta/citryl-CoA lyase [Amycolatopsis bartoniae]|uniref:Citryl-CoA lyase n=1 Tax=Amycolatopsis bartoniae TaxID=941986 RepID=A0A8H9MDV7_9PSEU|nr:CoA ester lyase [Amycolatopsis bartoniae]MBB2935314.1 citrate lyase subunit beta/citryl-CoA lyase [Amycolatopsis bartoniae]TVT06785.1 CoA ester lyase [Amycolatopsis bartoniae]GHF55944.1 citryl-CoA lyase [Amycolatopsis bartoniae]